MRIHPDRRRRTAALARLDPDTDWLEIYRRLTLWELPAEARFGFQLAFYRPLAVPRMAEVFHATGQVRHHATRRAYHTGIIIHEIIWGGVDSDRGQRMVKLMNAFHRRPGIHPDDMTYVLNCLIVVPTQFMNSYGWRAVTSAEQTATWHFYDTLGDRMGIARRPSSYPEAVEQLNQYETTHLAPSTEGTALTAAVLGAVRDRLPGPARRFDAVITSTLIGSPSVSAALGLPEPPAAVQRIARLAATARRAVVRRQAPPRRPSFWPGMPAGTIYPNGYQLHQLGPQHR